MVTITLISIILMFITSSVGSLGALLFFDAGLSSFMVATGQMD